MSKPIEGRDPEYYISSHCSVDKKGWERGVAATNAVREEAAKWISVNEKLPPTGHIVLTWTESDKMIDTAWLCEDDRWLLERTAPQDEHITYEVKAGYITHWMELPKPPRALAGADRA